MAEANESGVPVPEEIARSLEDAVATKNRFVLDAVINAAKDKYPDIGSQIDKYVRSLENSRLKKAREEPSRIASKNIKEGEEVKKPWSGNVEAGLNFQTGNTDKQNGRGSFSLNYKKGRWGNNFKFSARGGQEDDVTTDEEYRVRNQTRYNLSGKDYTFLELEYVNDRFSGFESRISESVGYGRTLYKNNSLDITGEASLGSRQSNLTDGSDKNSFLGRAGAKAVWEINDNLTFTEEITSSAAFDDSVITELNTELKSRISEKLYLKFEINIEHVDDAPVNRKHTDTNTVFGIGYDF